MLTYVGTIQKRSGLIVLSRHESLQCSGNCF